MYLLYFLDIDLSNLAQLEEEAPANGSSRSTGGILRGRALGNAFNIGDPFDDVPQDVAPLSRGRINITIVQQPPSDVIIENPTSHLKVLSPCYDTFGPLLKKVAKSYSPVRSKYLIICGNRTHFKAFISDHNYRIYVLDQKQWSIMGRYNVVVEDDENVVWEEDKLGKVTHILLVGFIRFFFQTLVQIMSRKMTASMLLLLQFHHHSISVLFL
jgi:hypothetical protein